MDIFEKINKGVGVAATAIIIAGGVPQVAQAIDNVDNVPKIEAKSICKNIENSIKNGTYEVNKLNMSLCDNMNTVLEKKNKVLNEKVQSSSKAEETKVKIQTLKAENNESSMAGTYLEKEAKYIKENGKTYCEIKVLAIDWMQNIKIDVDGKQVEYKVTKTGKAKVMGEDHQGGILKFEVSKVNPKITFHMYVIPMSHDVTFRVVGEEQAQTQTKPDTKPTDSQVKPVEKPGKDQVKPSKLEEKPVKPTEKPVKPVDVTTKPDTSKPKAEEIKVKIQTLKAENNEPSMAGTYLEKEAKYVKQDGKKYCEIKVLAIDWMKNIKIDVDGKEVEYKVTKTGEAEVMGAKHEGGILRFEVAKVNPKITFHMYVIPMSHDVTFRIVGEEQSQTKPDTKPTTKPDTKPTDSQVKPVEKPGKDQVKPSKLEEKPVKPTEKPVKPVDVTTKPSAIVDITKPGVYEIKSTFEVKNEEEKEIISKHVDKNINLKIENKKLYVILKIKGKKDSIKGIRVDDKEAKIETINQNVVKRNRLAQRNMSLLTNTKSDDETTTIRFNVPKLDSNVQIELYDEESKKDIKFKLNLYMNKPGNTEQPKPTKPTKPKEDSKEQTKKEVKKQIKVKVLKENSNEPSMAEKYLDKNITYTEKDGKKYFTVTLDKIEWMKNIEIFEGGKAVTYKKEVLGEKANLTFEVSGENSEITFHMNVVPMGNSKVAFRIVNVNSSSTSHSGKQSTSIETTKKDKEKKKDKRKDELKIDANKHGMYRVDVDILKSDSDDRSMAGQYLNSSCKYEVKGDKKYFTLTFNRMDWMKNITIYVNDDKKDYDIKSIGKNRSELKFETDGIGAVIEVKMNVVPMGNSRVTFRVLPKKSSLELLDEYKEDSSKKDETKPKDKDTNNKPKDDKDKTSNENDSKNQSNNNIKENENNKKDTNDKETSDSKKTSENKDNVTSENKEKEGLYEVGIKTLKENSNEPSMAGTYLGDKINIQLKDGKKYGIVKLNKSNWMKNINILVNGKDQKYEIINVKALDNGEKSTTLKFEIPDLNSEIKFKMNVEPMGNARVTFRVQIQKDTLKFLQSNEYDPSKAEEYLNDLANKTKKNIEDKNGQNIQGASKNLNSQEFKEKKLPKTGLPFGGGAIAAIGSVLSGLGITLMKKNKKRGE